MEKLDTERFKVEKRLCLAEGESKYHLVCFGHHLAKREGYKEHTGLEALHYYLVKKHHWTPAKVFSLSEADLRFLFAEEMSGWTLPKEARD